MSRFKSAENSAELRARLVREGSLILEIKVIPRAPVSGVAERMANGALKIKVAAPPEKGKANDEVCAVLAEYLDVPKRNVEVMLGHTSHQKRVRVVI
ncbi:DUF167 domain-containing protein [Acidipila rosea]|uniref:UPF0235 protein C7378_2053 n=1 Tax=Acidipila rosea TaxID=768535 RepID=A0A4R1L3B4_9BACT|nr:DUF167 domain-containing protein [Acidipila rosea]MBW4028340.1 DUF167 domain-containing protein [Acidobacteriota bacterium]MBW4045426.1 DUF167 domain-containing protein [Acidobacteriota bacterium]TCK72474.1 hypothetical protein C7378_2053 [Acidipila rosea]